MSMGIMHKAARTSTKTRQSGFDLIRVICNAHA